MATKVRAGDGPAAAKEIRCTPGAYGLPPAPIGLPLDDFRREVGGLLVARINAALGADFSYLRPAPRHDGAE